MELSSFSSITYWRDCLFSIVYPCLLCYRLIDHGCVDLFLGFLYCPIDILSVFVSVPHCLYHLQFPSSASYSFQSIDLWPPKVGLFLKYCILFDAMVKGIVSLLCLSALPLLVYKNDHIFFLNAKFWLPFKYSTWV